MTKHVATQSPQYWPHATLILITSITLYRIIFLTTDPFDLFFDEAQYWYWSLTPDLGYYSKPPIIAWIITLTTSVCGHEEWCIRLGSPILHALTAYGIYRITLELYQQYKTACIASLVYLTLPATTLSSALISTDPALLCCWTYALLFFIKAINTDHNKYWVLTACFSGLGMLSKYNMLIFLPSALLFLYLSEKHQHHLKSPKLWYTALGALILFLPNLYWNAANGFVSFLHTKDNANFSGGEALINLDKCIEFLASQLGVFGPILGIVLFATVIRHYKIKTNEQNTTLLLSFIIPMLFTISIVSLISRAHANWAAPIYIASTILITHLLITHHPRWLTASTTLHIAIMFIFINLAPIITITGITLSGQKTEWSTLTVKDPMKRVKGWKELGQTVTKLLQQEDLSTVLADDRKTIAELLYYTPNITAIKWNKDQIIHDHYELTTTLNQHQGPILYITRSSKTSKEVISHFTTVKSLGTLTIPLYDDTNRNYKAYRLEGFKGY